MSPAKTNPFQRLALRVIHQRDTPGVFRCLKMLEQAEFVSPDQIRKQQWDRLQKLLRHAAENVPYYRDLFSKSKIRAEDIRTPQDFESFPLLTKDILQTEVDRLTEDTPSRRRKKPNASGGSTGKPVRFYQDAHYWAFARASQWFVEGWWGIYPGNRTASIWGCDRDLPEQNWKERLRLEVEQTRVCNAFSMTETRMAEFAKMLSAWKPIYVTGYASALELFARFLSSRPDLRVRPHAVKSTAEALTSSQRMVIEKAFAAPVYNFYGSREVNNLAAECPAHQGLHVNSLGRYLEIVDESGKQLPPGKPGRIVITDLTNFVMPFLRYQIEDIGSWHARSCSCGRSFPLLETVWGRSSDFIVTPSGKLIHGEFFTHLFYDMDGIDQFQVVQKTITEVRVDIVPQRTEEAISTDALRNRLVEAMGPGVQCQIRIVNKIERSTSGKHRFTISEVPVPWKRVDTGSWEQQGAGALPK
jgi:phenylacetate-CoA ligase